MATGLPIERFDIVSSESVTATSPGDVDQDRSSRNGRWGRGRERRTISSFYSAIGEGQALEDEVQDIDDISSDQARLEGMTTKTIGRNLTYDYVFATPSL